MRYRKNFTLQSGGQFSLDEHGVSATGILARL
jgi:hypothetical protein